MFRCLDCQEEYSMVHLCKQKAATKTQAFWEFVLTDARYALKQLQQWPGPDGESRAIDALERIHQLALEMVEGVQ